MGSPMVFQTAPPQPASKARMTCSPRLAGGPEASQKGLASCHAVTDTTKASDGAPPLSYIARDNKERPAWIHGWLMDPHPPMPGIMLSRQQINDVIAY